MIAPDDKVVEYLRDRPRAPRGPLWDDAVARWKTLRSDEGAAFDRDIRMDASRIEPMVTWGTSPDQASAIGGVVPDPAQESDATRRRDMQRALEYMGLAPGVRLDAIRIDRAFIGSCTNGRIEDLRDAARVLRGRRIAQGVRGMVVPGSTAVHDQAEAEGLDRVFLDAGFEWRQSGCSMCVAMNDDHLLPGERCASSTNRNFEGRQGAGGRTHLMSPAMVAAAAVAGRLTDVRAARLAMKPFTVVTGVAAPLPRANIDTDQIMPKQFLKGVDRNGLADGFLFDMRFSAPGVPRPEFILNRDAVARARSSWSSEPTTAAAAAASTPCGA